MPWTDPITPGAVEATRNYVWSKPIRNSGLMARQMPNELNCAVATSGNGGRFCMKFIRICRPRSLAMDLSQSLIAEEPDKIGAPVHDTSAFAVPGGNNPRGPQSVRSLSGSNLG